MEGYVTVKKEHLERILSLALEAYDAHKDDSDWWSLEEACKVAFALGVVETAIKYTK